MTKCFEQQKKAAKKKSEVSNFQFKSLCIGDVVLINVPSVDHSPLDLLNITSVILEMKNDLYKIGTKKVIINTGFSRAVLIKSGTKCMT